MRKLAALLVVFLSSGCHLTYDIHKTADPVQKIEPKQIRIGPHTLSVNGDDVKVASISQVEQVTTYVGEHTTEYHVKSSAFGSWTDEHKGFRLSYFAMENGPFPGTRWWWGPFMTDHNDLAAFLTGFFLFGPPAALTAFDLLMLIGCPVADGTIMLMSGICDCLTGGLSAPIISIKGALDSSNPKPQSEIMSVDNRTVSAGAQKLHWSVDVPGEQGGDTVPQAGDLVLPLGPIIEKALAMGRSSIEIAVLTTGENRLRDTTTLGLGDLMRLHRIRLERKGLDRGGMIAEWRKLLGGLPATGADSVRGSVQRELSSLGLFVGLDDRAALAGLQSHGGGIARMADGVEVDWSSGTPTRAPKAKAELTLLEGRGEITAGDPIVAVVTVTNVGKGPLYRLLATVKSETSGWTTSTPVILGKVEPGTTVTRRIEMPTLVTTPESDIGIDVSFQEANEFAPTAVQGKLHVKAAIRPALAISARAVDDGSGESVGNGDGVVQRGETIEYRIGIKNTGTAPAVDTRLALTIQDSVGIAVFGDRSRDLGTIPPGEVRETTVTISVKPGFAKSEVPVYAVVKESSPFQAQKEQDLTLKIDERAPRKVIAIQRPVVVKETTALLNAAEKDARSLGRVEKGSQLTAVGELDEFLQVEYAEGKRAWLRRKDVTFELGSIAAPAAPDANASKGAVAVVREFAHVPPVIVFATPAEGRKTETGETEIALKSTVKGDDGIASVLVTINGKPYEPKSDSVRGIGGVKAAPTGPKSAAAKIVSIDEKVPLQPGENTIAIEAVDSVGEKSRAEVVVVRSVREPTVVALIVGIDKYDDGSIPALRYAEADAKAVAEFFRGPKSPVKNPDHVKLLLGKDATGAAIRVAIEKHLIAFASHKEDMAIFYYAGHGFSEDGRYFLAGADTQLSSLRATALKLGDLKDYWQDVKAERKVFLADACHSGGLVGLRGDNTIGAGLLGSIEGKGKVTIAAAREKQMSCESPKLGHGVFTAALLEGLDGRADQEAGNRDGRVSVRELISFLDREVPALARSESHEQNPNYDIAEAEGEILLTR